MKIGILTLPLHTNYGGILQAYALQTVLERMGHEVKVIDKSRYHQISLWKIPFAYIYRGVKKFIFGKNVNIRQEKYYNFCLDRDVVTQKYTRPFIDLHVKLLHVEKFSELKESDFDAIIVGSDQIWRAIYTRLFMQSTTAAFLEFASSWTSIRRVSYAASFGTSAWEYSPKDTKMCKRLIQQFDTVSVRENDGIELCEKYLNYANAVQVLDPTFLLDQEDYKNLLGQNESKHKNSVFCYILDLNEQKKQLIQSVEENLQLKSFFVNSRVDDWNAPIQERIQPPVEDWLQGFVDADFVITDSFHACVFSIIFKKQFIVIGNEKRGLSRFSSLLTMFGLESRIVLKLDDFDVRNLDDIDYDCVYEKLEVCKNKSLTFLEKSLL